MINPQDLRITNYPLEPSGGMTVGLTTSGIIVHHIPTGIGVSCDSERSQHANKDKALSILERLVSETTTEDMFQDSLSVLWQHAPHLVPTPVVNNHNIGPHGVGKVNMIKMVREATGRGLKEAKELTDKHHSHIDCLNRCVQEAKGGYCTIGDACVCGGDLPSVRVGCYNWSNVA